MHYRARSCRYAFSVTTTLECSLVTDHSEGRGSCQVAPYLVAKMRERRPFQNPGSELSAKAWRCSATVAKIHVAVGSVSISAVMRLSVAQVLLDELSHVAPTSVDLRTSAADTTDLINESLPGHTLVLYSHRGRSCSAHERASSSCRHLGHERS